MVNDQLALNRSFLALSHPLRRAIVERLAKGPATVGQATRGLPVTKPAITKHLKMLEEAGVVRRTINGRTHVLSLEPRRLDEAAGWLGRHRALWEATFDRLERHLALEKETAREVEDDRDTG